MTEAERKTIQCVATRSKGWRRALFYWAHLLRQSESEMRNLEQQVENYREAFRREQAKGEQVRESLASALVTIRRLEGK